MNKFSQIIPNSYWGRAIFLLLINRVFMAIITPLEMSVSNIFKFSTSVEQFFSGTANVDKGSLFFDFFFYLLGSFVNIAVFEMMIVWLLVYVCFRFTRNRNFIGRDFFWISVITFAIQYLTHIVASVSGGELSVNFTLVFAFFVCSYFAWLLFKIPAKEKEEPRVYLKRFSSILCKSKWFYIFVFIYMIVDFLSFIYISSID